MFLVPKRDFRTDEGREFVETRRRDDEAMFTDPIFFMEMAYFWALIARVFQKHLLPRVP